MKIQYLIRYLGLAGTMSLLARGLEMPAQELAVGPWEKYFWQTYRVSHVAASASNLLAELRAEVQKILKAGPLAPVRTVYADLEQDPYFMYWQGGRIITTLAYAWPHLTMAQQDGVRRYVRAELASEQRAPWTPQGHIPPDQGARREWHSFHEARGWDRYWAMWGSKKPTLGSFYGLWLYADRSGDWDCLKQHYSQLTTFYARKAGEGELYGTMGAHIAMARIARHFNDPTHLSLALSNGIAAFHHGTNFSLVETNTQKYWKERYEPRQRNRNYQGWMFLDLCPETGRYLADYVKPEVVQRHQEGLKIYPLFWLREVPYGSRWTGDEGLGIPTELMGMLVPIERWVALAPAETLVRYTRSAPLCCGDCYWLEMLVQAIESTGKTEWIELEKGPHN
jgi:hypothetical protein